MKTAWKTIQRTVLAAVVLVTATLMTSASALAQQFEKIENIPKQEIPAGRFVGIAYGIIWLAVLTYVVLVAGGLKRVNHEIADLKRRLGSGGDGSRS